MHDIQTFGHGAAIVFDQNGQHFFANQADGGGFVVVGQKNVVQWYVFEAKNHPCTGAKRAVVVGVEFHGVWDGYCAIMVVIIAKGCVMRVNEHVASVAAFLPQLQGRISQALAQADGVGQFAVDAWQSPLGQGRTMVLRDGAVFEQAGVNFSHVKGTAMPVSATAHRPHLAGAAFEAMGVSLVVHPINPYVPTSHANVRLFVAYPDQGAPVWWFGGGFDLTPFYPFDEDVLHWHQVASDVCAPFGDGVYDEFKQHCDAYFYLKHRQETRGVGGLFYDDLDRWDFDTCFALMRAVGQGYLDAYLPIVERRRGMVWGERERQFQLYRRGRYVEFNLVWDRGTLFGLQSGGRTESILMSMPPLVRFEYQYTPEADSDEAKLAAYLRPRTWLVK